MIFFLDMIIGKEVTWIYANDHCLKGEVRESQIVCRSRSLNAGTMKRLPRKLGG